MTYAYHNRRQWIGIAALAAIVVVFLAVSLPRYFTGDPAQSRVPATFALHYPLLVGHVMFGSVAIVCAVAQIWPGLRRRRPALHRRVGRVYAYAASPAAVLAMIIGAATPFGPFLAVSNVILAALWLWLTVTGFLAGRAHRFAKHRKAMILSATLALSIITNRVWTPVLFIVLHRFQDSVFGGDEQSFFWVVAGLGGWLGWTLPMALVASWLRRRPIMPLPSISQRPPTALACRCNLPAPQLNVANSQAPISSRRQRGVRGRF